MASISYKNHLKSSADLVTTYEAMCKGIMTLALERNRRATPNVAEARALQEAASKAKTVESLLDIKGIETALLTTAGLSDYTRNYLLKEDRKEAIRVLIKNYLEPAGANFVEELVFRFLLMKGISLSDLMCNADLILAQRKLTRAIISTLSIAGIKYRWLDAKTRKWIDCSDDDTGIEMSLRGLTWKADKGDRTLIYNLTVPIVKNNVDFCLLNSKGEDLDSSKYENARLYIAIGELKGGIDPAGADEHWKTARTALDRIREAFSKAGHKPLTFFVGAAVEKKMATEIWSQLKKGILSNAANLNETKQVVSLSMWLYNL